MTGDVAAERPSSKWRHTRSFISLHTWFTMSVHDPEGRSYYSEQAYVLLGQVYPRHVVLRRGKPCKFKL